MVNTSARESYPFFIRPMPNPRWVRLDCECGAIEPCTVNGLCDRHANVWRKHCRSRLFCAKQITTAFVLCERISAVVFNYRPNAGSFGRLMDMDGGFGSDTSRIDVDGVTQIIRRHLRGGRYDILRNL